MAVTMAPLVDLGADRGVAGTPHLFPLLPRASLTRRRRGDFFV